VGGLRDYTDASFAELLPPGEVDAFTETILRLADDPEERKRRGRLARKHVEERPAAAKVAAQTMAVYEEVLRNES
jgi:glycosyltransferase involved in cell wall biosynthesis